MACEINQSGKVKNQLDPLYGTVLRSSAIERFTLTETAYPPSLRLPKHAHPTAYFCFILQGTFTEERGRRSRTHNASTLLFHPAEEVHADQFHTSVRCLNLLINTHRPIATLSQPAEFRGGALMHLATKLYREIRETDEVSALAIEGLALEMVAVAARSVKRPRGAPPSWLKRARAMVHENSAEGLTVSDLARAVGVHPTHLAREFHRYYQCTIGEYARQRRVESARQLISSSNAPLSEIAVAAGFFDQSHLTRTFKMATGMSPAAYRKAFRAR